MQGHRLISNAAAAITAAFVVLVTVAPAGAAGGGFGARPAHGNATYIVTQLEAGDSHASAIVLTSGSKTPEHLDVYPVDGVTSSTSGAVYATRDASARGAGSWLKPAVAHVTLLPGHSLTVPFGVHVPAAAAAGDHLAGIAIEPHDASTSLGRLSVQSVFREVVGVLVQVPGAASFQPHLSSASLGLVPGTQVGAVELGLSDAGFRLGKPGLRVSLTGPNGYHRTVTRQLDTILPGDAIGYRLPWPGALAAGTYHVVARATGGDSVSTVTTTVTLGTAAHGTALPLIRASYRQGGGQPPWWVIAVAAVIASAGCLLALLFALYPSRRRRRLAVSRRMRIGGGVAIASLLCGVALFGAAESRAAGSLTSVGVALSNGVASATNVSYTFSFTTATGENLTAVKMTLPSGTGGSPTLGAVSGAPTGGTLSVSGTTLTYTFAATTYLNPGVNVSIGIAALTNTSTLGSYTSTITTIGPPWESYPTIDAGTSSAFAVSGGTLTSLGWTLSNAVKSATSVAYTYAFTTATAASLSSVTMSVPTGTAGTPAVGTVSGVPSGGSVSLASNTLTYSFSGTSVAANSPVTIQITGLTNTTTAGSYSSQIATLASSTVVDAAATPSASITGGALGSPSWSVSSSSAGTTGVAYTYTFTIGTSGYLTSLQFAVPSGTAGTPTVGPITSTNTWLPTNGTASLSGTTLTYAFGSSYLGAGASVSIEIDGLTNTATTGSYTALITSVGASGAVDSGGTAPISITGAALTSPIWSVSSTASGATGVTYTYTFTTATTASLTSVTMTVPPGTAGTPAVGTVSGVPSGGSVSLASNTLTYSFSATSVASATAVSIAITGMKNTTTTGSYTAQLTTVASATPVNTGLTSAVSIAGGTVSSPIWTTSASSSGATGATYSYTFSTGSSSQLTSVTMSVPPGTAGTPTVTSVSGVPSGGTVTLASNTLTYSFSQYVNAGTAVSLAIGGLTNTVSTGTYTSQIATKNGITPVDTGVTASVTITGGALTSPIWSVSSTGSGTSGVTYTYTFTTSSSATLTSVSMSVPPGTAGTPVVGTVSGVPSGGTVSLASNTLTYSFTGTPVSSATAVSIGITGMKNTTTTGSYTAQLTTFAASAPIDTGLTSAVSITGGTLSSPIWTTSASTSGATGATYTYTFSTGSSSSLSSVTMSVPPGTAGTPTVTSVSGVPSGGTVTLASNTLTYSFGAQYLNAGTAASLVIGGLTNTVSTGTYTSQIATKTGSTPVDTGVTSGVAISGAALTNTGWALSNAASGATGVTYTYTFTTASTANLTSVTMSVPPGTAGTPALGTVTNLPSSGTVSLSSGTITFSFASTPVTSGTAVTVHITGMKNTTTTGSYTSQVATSSGTPVDTGTSGSVSITGASLTSPIWTIDASGSGATGVTYTYSFTTASGAGLTGFTMSVPAGTAGAPTVTSVTSTNSSVPTNGTIALASNTLTYAFSAYVNGGTAVTITIGGMKNTLTPGSYTSNIASKTGTGPVDSGVTAGIAITGGVLGSPIWTPAGFATGATGIAYAYTFTTASSSLLDSITMTVPPGTAGTPTVTVATGVPSNGTVTLASNTLTYSFASTQVNATTALAIAFAGLTNTTTTGSYTSQLTTYNGPSPIDAGVTATVSFGGGSLASATWRPSSYKAGASSTYTYTFNTGSGATLTSVSMTVPPGTTGTPAVGSVTSTANAMPTNGTVVLASNTLTYSFGAAYVNAGYTVSIQVTGLTNSGSAGSYTSQVATKNIVIPVDTGTSPTIALGNGNPFVAYVANASGASVMSLHAGSGITGGTTSLGTAPQAIAFSADGATAYVLDSSANTITAVTTSTGTAGTPTTLTGCTTPKAIAVTPAGGKAYVACSGNAKVVPVTLPGLAVGSAISVGTTPAGIAISPDGATAYAVASGSGNMTPITVASNTAGGAIALTGCATPQAIAILPSGATGYVTCSGNAKVLPVSLPAGSLGSTISVGTTPSAIATTADGTTLYVANAGSGTVTPITVSGGSPGAAITVGTTPSAIAVDPGGVIAYVANGGSGTVSQIRLSDNTVTQTVSVGSGPAGIAFAPDQAPAAALTVTPGAAGSATSFDASASTVAYGTIASYAWTFGDGTTATTGTPTTTHTYAVGCSYTATLTETDSAGTSTTQVFTDQQLARNGGLGAQVTSTFGVTRSLGFATSPTDVSFATALHAMNQTVTSGLPLDVGVGTATSGWSISATSTTFTTGGATPYTLPTTAVTVQSTPTVACDGSVPCTLASNGIAYPFVLPAGTSPPTSAKLFQAAASSGVCDQTVTPSFTLSVPSNTYGGTYTSTWTLTLSSGP